MGLVWALFCKARESNKCSQQLARGFLEWHHVCGGKELPPEGTGGEGGEPVSEDHEQQRTDSQEGVPARRRERDDGGAAANGGRRSADQEPDVLLDVANLEVEKITLEVDSLRAHISVLAELANLVKPLGRGRCATR